jgi:hypothetical protein
MTVPRIAVSHSWGQATEKSPVTSSANRGTQAVENCGKRSATSTPRFPQFPLPLLLLYLNGKRKTKQTSDIQKIFRDLEMHKSRDTVEKDLDIHIAVRRQSAAATAL